MKNTIFALFLLGSLLTIGSCHNHDDEDATYEVAINILQPSADKTFAVGAFMPIEVTFSRPNEVIHNVLIQVLDANNVVVETLLEKHAHVTGSFTYNETNGFKPTKAGTLKLKAQTTDENKLQPNIKEFTFTVN